MKFSLSKIEQQSDWHYCVLKLPAKERDAIAGIANFYQQIEKIFLHTRDLNAANLKLEWWKEESVKKFQEPIETFQLPKNLLIEIITAFQENLMPTVFEKFEDVTIHIMRTAGARELLIAHILNANETLDLESIYQLAYCVEIIHHIQHLRDYARKGFFYFAESEMKKMDVSVQALQSFHTTDNIRKLLKLQAEKAERAFNNVENIHHQYLKNLKVRSELAMQTLKLIKETNFDVLENYIAVPPIRKWWHVTWNYSASNC